MRILRISILILLSISCVTLIMCKGNERKTTPQKQLNSTELKPLTSFFGRIIFHSNFDGDNEIYLLTKDNLTKITDNTWNDEYPVWSPDGKKIAYTANPQKNYDIFLMTSKGTDIVPLASSKSNETEPSWYPDGKSLNYTQETKKLLRKNYQIYSLNLDTKSRKKMMPNYTKSHGISRVSPADLLVTFTGKQTLGWDVAVYDLKNHKMTFLDEGGKSCRARFSPDGKRLAYVSSKADGKGDIWLMKPDGSEKIRLTERNETYDYFPTWSPDGKYIAFNSSKQHNHNGDWQLFIINVRTKEVSLLFDSPGNDVFPDWIR